MTRIVVIAKCKDPSKWEAGFKTHRELFKTYSVSKPVSYAIAQDNQIATCFEPDDVATFMKAMDSPETKAAMEFDGLVMDSVAVFVLDKELTI